MKYVVLKNFKDKYTNQYYGMGFTYETEEAERAAELERGGYIAVEGSEMAQMVQSNQTSQAAQTNKQNGQAAEEAYTVINGKRVSLSQAQAAEAAKENSVTKTGVQQSHDNSSEPVKAGARAKQTKAQQQQQQQQTVKTVNIQSGQQELEQHMQQAGQQAGQQAVQQELKESMEQVQQTKARARTKNQASE